MTTEDSFPDITAVRTAVNTYTVRSESGAELRIGPRGAEGTFRPVELLQAALAGCAALSAEAQLASQLGLNFEATATVEAVRHADQNRVEELIATMTYNASELSPEEQAKLLVRTERVIERLCAIKRSLREGIEPSLTVRGAGPDV